jgi:ubiquinone/menaquinone biosynthesis C-methylase UbiE
MTSCRIWDLADGDGALLHGIEDESLDFVHSSHSLEHMTDPAVALRNWVRVTKKGGHIVIMVPDEDTFEQGQWPSEYSNGDHVTSWTIGKTKSWCRNSISIIEFIKPFLNEISVLKIETIDSLYRYGLQRLDQTRFPVTECGIEIILRKLTDDDIKRCGRLPKETESEILTIEVDNHSDLYYNIT